MSWIKISDKEPDFGFAIIGLNPVNYKMRSEHWIATPMKRLNKEIASLLYLSTDPEDFDVDEWYSPLSDIQDDCSRPWIWAYMDYPTRLPSDYFPDSAPDENKQ